MNRISISLISLLCTPPLVAAPPLPISTSYWKSPAFLKEFNGSYRINANIEPVLSSTERGLLRDMQNLMSSGKRSDTISKLKSSSLYKSSPAIQFNLANVLSETGQLDEAISNYKKAITTMPSFRRAHQNIAYAYYRNNDTEKAYEHLLEVVRLGGSDGSVHGLLGHCFLGKELYEPALRSFREALITQPDATDWKFGIAQALFQLNRPDEALVIYETLAQKDPKNTDIQLQLALVYHDQGNTDGAVTILEYLRRQNILDDEYQLLLGTLLIGQQNTTVGAEALKRILSKEDFKKSEAALSAIQYCLKEEQSPLALELHGLIKQDQLTPSGTVRYQRIKAQIYLEQAANHPEALTILKQLIKANPTDSHSLFLLGKQCLLAEEPHQALMIFDQAIHAKASHSSQAQLEKAQTLVKLKSYKKAIEELESYLDEQPENERVRKYLEAIKNLSESSQSF